MRVAVHTWDPGFERSKAVLHPSLEEALASLTRQPPAGGCIALSRENEGVSRRPDPWVALGAGVVATEGVARSLPQGTFVEAKGWQDALRWRLAVALPIHVAPEEATEPSPVGPATAVPVTTFEHDNSRKPLLGHIDYEPDYLDERLAATKIPPSLQAFLSSVGIHTIGEANNADAGVLAANKGNRVKEPLTRIRDEVAAYHARWLKGRATAPPPSPETVPVPPTPEEAVEECREMGLLWSLRAGSLRCKGDEGWRLLRLVGIDGPPEDGPDTGHARMVEAAVKSARDLAGWPQVLSEELLNRRDSNGRVVPYGIGLDAWWRGLTHDAVRRLCRAVASTLFGNGCRLENDGHTLVLGVSQDLPEVAIPEPDAPVRVSGLRKLAGIAPFVEDAVPQEARPAPRVPVRSPEPVAQPVPARIPRRQGWAKACFVNPVLVRGRDAEIIQLLSLVRDMLVDTGIVFLVAPPATRLEGGTGESLLRRAEFVIHEEVTFLRRQKPFKPQGQIHEDGAIRRAYEEKVNRKDRLQSVTMRILVASRSGFVPLIFPVNDAHDDLAMSTNQDSNFWTCLDDGLSFPQGLARMCLQRAGVRRRDEVLDLYPGGNPGLALACGHLGIKPADGWAEIHEPRMPEVPAKPVKEPA